MSTQYKTIYTDGGCHNNGDRKGTGSYAFLEPTDLSNEYVIVFGKYFTDTTNNRTEMLAAIEGIKHIKNVSGDDDVLIEVISDSGYLVKGYTDPTYLDSWIKRGWVTSSKTPVMNKDLWEELVKISWHIRFTFKHMRGHGKDRNPLDSFWNDIVDKVCTFIMNDIENPECNETYVMLYIFKDKSIVLCDKLDLSESDIKEMRDNYGK